jgi:hypothetical protein
MKNRSKLTHDLHHMPALLKLCCEFWTIRLYLQQLCNRHLAQAQLVVEDIDRVAHNTDGDVACARWAVINLMGAEGARNGCPTTRTRCLLCMVVYKAHVTTEQAGFTNTSIFILWHRNNPMLVTLRPYIIVSFKKCPALLGEACKLSFVFNKQDGPGRSALQMSYPRVLRPDACLHRIQSRTLLDDLSLKLGDVSLLP